MSVWAWGHRGAQCDLSSSLQTPPFAELSFCCILSFVLVTSRAEEAVGPAENRAVPAGPHPAVGQGGSRFLAPL